MQHDVFLSYCRADRDMMVRVQQTLSEAGLRVWTDEGIPPGTVSWKRAIHHAILNASTMIAIFSPDAVESRWVLAELDFAEMHGKPIYPLMVNGDERSAIPFGYAAFQWVDLREAADYDRSMRFVIRTIRERLQNPAPEAPPILPQPFEWCEISLGSARSENGASPGDHPEADRFYISKYPITIEQYQVFAESPDGYADVRWWDYSTQATAWRKKHTRALGAHFSGLNLPRESVSWYEAVAFTRWLSFRTGVNISLPTEQQWQFAAQGSDMRDYPWETLSDSKFVFADVDTSDAGLLLSKYDTRMLDLLLQGPVALQTEMLTRPENASTVRQLLEDLQAHVDTSRCNSYESGIEKTTPVDQFRKGASPFGVMDMSGNVWEWCRSAWNSADSSLRGNSHRVLRGGSWYHFQYTARVTYRTRANPAQQLNDTGFRIVALI